MDSAIESKVTPSQKRVRSDTSRVWKISLFALLAVSLVFGVAFYFFVVKTPRLVETEYQAVLLDNGSSFFGKIVQNTADYVVLREVYYVQSRTNPQSKEVSNVLIKRGQEWHAPDRMIINRRHLVFFEPVSPDSTVARLITESKRH
jgi:hypothetical protein